MAGEAILTGLGIVVILIALIKFRKPINRFADHCDNVVTEWCGEQEVKLREKTFERMHEFLGKKEYYLPELEYERMRARDSDSRYSEIAHDKAKLMKVFMKEDLLLAIELSKRQEKIRDLITVIERTGQWPKTIHEINEIMEIKMK